MTTFLILATWSAWVLACIGLGIGVLRLVRCRLRPRDELHAGLWIGLGAALLVASTAQIFFGLGTAPGTALATFLMLSGLATLVWALWTNRTKARDTLRHSLTWRRLPVFLALGLLLVALIDMAYLATGEPMDADAGSYRIGSILYASEYRLIPGLTNLHFRFGFDSSLWPFAALIGQGPWFGQGYRLVTGVFLTALIADALIRLSISRRGGPLPGDWFVVIAAGFTGGVILTDVGRWVPSPAQDITVLVLFITSTAFLADYLTRTRNIQMSAAMSLITAGTAGSLRPIGWILFMTTLVITVVVMGWKSGTPRQVLRVLGLPVVFAGMFGVVSAIRSTVLSGWILYPLDLFPISVTWRTPTTDIARDGITAYARAPGVDMDVVLASNAWFGPWLEAFLSSRELYFFRLMLIGALLPLLWPAGRRAWAKAWKPMMLTLVPAFVSALVWFATAPDVRFGWGPLLSLAAVPGSFILWAKGYPQRVATWVGLGLIAAFMATQVLNGRYLPRGEPQVPVQRNIGPLTVTLALAPPPTPESVRGVLGDGTPILYPAVGGNCYDIFPLCLIPGSGSGVRSLGDEISDGFATISDGG